MNDLWTIVKQVADEHTEWVVNASLEKLSKLAVEKAAGAGIIINPPSSSHMRYILKKLGYELPPEGKGFVYRSIQEREHE